MSKCSIRIFFAAAIYLISGFSLCWAQNAPPLTDEEKTKIVEEMFTSPYTEEMYYRTDRLLLTATGSLLPVHKAPSVASIITSEDIEKIGATTLNEVLETVPGLHVMPSTIAGMDSIYSVRGVHTSLNPHVLMLINGLPISNLYTGSRPASFLMPVANISRVEVIRGPGSAVHGADAFAGVINIITKDIYEIDGSKGGVRIGSFDTYDYWLQQSGKMSGWDVVFSFENQRTQGDNDRVIEADSQTILDNLFLTAASLAPGTIDTSYNTYDTHLSFKKNNFTLRLWSWILDDSSERDGVTNVLSRTSSINNEQYLADLLYQNSKLFRDTDINVRVSYLYRQEDGFTELYPAGTTMLVGADGNLFSTPTASKVTFSDGVFGNPRKNDSQTTLDLSANYSGIKKHRVRVGTGFKYLEEKTEEYKNFGPGVIDGLAGPTDTIDGTLTDVSNTPYVFMEDQDRKIFHISLQDEWSYARSWELTAGVRYDNYSDFGNTINPRAALVWETRYDLTTKLLYGKAFRPPSFAELYNINNPVFLGNKDLEPEKIETFELAFDYQPTLRIHSLLNVFYYEIEDLIEIVQDPSGTTKTAQNNKDQTGYGFELETKWEATDSLTFSTNFAFQKSKDTNTKETVADAPELQIYFNTHWTFMPLWSVDAQVYWIGERERTSVDIRENVDAYTLTNLTIRRKNIFEKFDITFAVRNLFDEDVREPGPAPNPPYPPAIPNDYSMEGRSFYSEIKYHF